ncbi:hypothetical protein T439DRAFT_359235 [Meredithblackwellia eburnea MCA 4105]
MSLQVTYSVVPPPTYDQQNSNSVPAQTQTSSYEITTSQSQDQTAHFESLDKALQKARDDLNANLTGWKDALKGLESDMGASKKKKKQADEEEGDEEDDEEELALAKTPNAYPLHQQTP